MLKLFCEVMVLQVLYLDVFFLINFTVDLLSAFFSIKFLHIKSNIWRLSILAALGSVCAVVDVFITESIYLQLLNSLIFLPFAALIISKNISIGRRVKFVAVFLTIELGLGGAVYYLYGILDRYSKDFSEYFLTGTENRKALIFSVIILFSIGVLKLLVMLFSNQVSKKSIRVKIKIENSDIETDALVDSGNLVKDPMNMNPVMFVKREFARKFIPNEVIELLELDLLGPGYRKRIRLVPVTRDGKTHIMTGVLPDTVMIIGDRATEEVSLTLVIDKEGGTYGGYDALIPSCVIGDV